MQITSFYYCRICRTNKNLKFTTQQLQAIYKAQHKNGRKKLLTATPTLGNICQSCDEQLQNFHRLDDEDSELDIDDVGNGKTMVSTEGVGVDNAVDKTVRRRIETPVIVDDDKLLYDLFLQKVEKQRNDIGKMRRDLTTDNESKQHSLGNNDDPEIIEVMASREIIKEPALTPMPNSARCREGGQNVIDVIDLALEDEHSHPGPNINPVVMNGDIAKFCHAQQESSTANTVEQISRKIPTKQCRKKTYVESELRLIASLNLISSDSEADEPLLLKGPNRKPANPIISAAVSTVSVSTSPSKIGQHKCNSCSVRLPDAESLLVHQRIHSGILCPVCQMGFSTSQRLVHHMRFRHRSYEGKELSERPRCGQDSAMTIRLRYQETYTYYECQLCGRIDAVFRDHKQHVMQSHAAESKSLKDPMMQELKCPICKVRCGMQHLFLCRHLLSAHTASECKPYIREVTNPRDFEMNNSRQNILAQTAHIYQLSKRQTCFFQCKQCRKVVAGYTKYMSHLAAHQSRESGVQKCPETKSTEKNSTQHLQVRTVAKETARSKQSKPKNRPVKKNITNVTASSPPPTVPTLPLRQPPTTTMIQAKRSKKMRHRKRAPLAEVVKVKPPLRTFSTQKYICVHCQRVCKGFCDLNLHTLSEHAAAEYHRCAYCLNSFKTHSALQLHEQSHLRLQQQLSCKSQRKRTIKILSTTKADSGNALLDENSNTNINTSVIISSGTNWKRQRLDNTSERKSCLEPAAKQPHELANNTTMEYYPWLHELLELSNKRGKSAACACAALRNGCAARAVQAQAQCRYCTLLFITATELETHERAHQQRQEVQCIKRHAFVAH